MPNTNALLISKTTNEYIIAVSLNYNLCYTMGRCLSLSNGLIPASDFTYKNVTSRTLTAPSFPLQTLYRFTSMLYNANVVLPFVLDTNLTWEQSQFTVTQPQGCGWALLQEDSYHKLSAYRMNLRSQRWLLADFITDSTCRGQQRSASPSHFPFLLSFIYIDVRGTQWNKIDPP